MKLNSLIKQFLGLVVVLAMTLTLVPLPANAAGKNPYTSLYSAVMIDGQVKQIGNSLLECAGDDLVTGASCTTAKNFGTIGGKVSNGNDKFMMQALDVDGDASTTNSSSADLIIPVGFKVKEAFAFWGGSWGGGFNDPTCRNRQNIALCGDSLSTYATLANGNEKKAKVKIGTSAYQPLTATNSYFLTSQARGYYASNVSVGSVLAPLPAGTHKITMSLDVISAGWLGGFNGWSLFTVLEKIDLTDPCDITKPLPAVKNISISDGMILTSDQGVDTADAKVSVAVDVTGFKIPAAGGAGSNFYMSTLDGDPEYDLDTFTLGPVTGTEVNYDRGGDVLPNPFRSYIDPLSNSNRLPNNTNTFGYDIIANNLGAAGATVFPAGATSVKAIFKGGIGAANTANNADRYSPMYFATETPTEAPFVCIIKDSVPVPNTTVKVGDTIEYKLKHVSNGSVDTINDVTSDIIPAGTTYVPASLTVDGVAQTDATGDDLASFNGTSVFFTPAGGIAPKQTVRNYAFKVKVTDITFVGKTVDNQAKVIYKNPSLPAEPAVTIDSNIVKHPIVAPNAPIVTLVKSSVPPSGTPVKLNDEITYTLVAENTGLGNATAQITSDKIPTGTTYVPASLTVDTVAQTDISGDDGATYDAAAVGGAEVRYSPSAGLLAAGTKKTFTFKVKVTDGTIPLIRNVGSITFTDPTKPTPTTIPSNEVSHPQANPTDVTIVKSSVPPSGTPVKLNDEIVYTLVIENKGLGNAINQVTSDKIPTGTTYVPASLTVDTVATTDAPDEDGAAYNATAMGGAEVIFNPSAGILAAGTKKTFTFKVKVTDGTIPLIRNVGSITFTDPTKPTPTTIPSNEVSHPQTSGPQMNIIKSSVPPSGTDVKLDDIIEYTLKATNTGLGKAINVIISDVIPTSAMYIDGSVTAGGLYDPITRKLTWNIAEVLPGASVTGTFKVKVMPVKGESMVKNVAMLRYTDPSNPNTPIDTPSNIIEHPLFACVGDYIWMDTNKNGIQDTDEQGIARVDIMIMKKGTTTVMMSTKTDLMGYYKFCVPKGSYDIKVMIPAGHKSTMIKIGSNMTDSDIDSMGMMSVSLTAGQMNYGMDGGLIKTELPTPRTGGSSLPIVAFGSLILLAGFLLVENKRRSTEASSYRGSSK